MLLIDRLITAGQVSQGKRELGLDRPDYLHLWAKRAAAKGLIPAEDVPPKPPPVERDKRGYRKDAPRRAPSGRKMPLAEVPPHVEAGRLSKCHPCGYWRGSCQHPEATIDCASKRIPTDPRKAYSFCPLRPPKWDKWESPRPPVLARYDENNLAAGQPGKRFNASLLEWQGGYILCYRDGWSGSCLHIATLDKDLRILATKKLEIRHRHAAAYGREDPRLFLHDGKLHVAFTGVMRRRQIYTNQLYARLTDAFDVEAVYHPHISGRAYWEKNHAYFSHEGKLYAIYTIAPHRILEIDEARTKWAYETTTPAPWNGGELRGGASPVLVGDEYWHFFHGKAQHRGADCYNIGLYTFETKPPFRILRIIPEPILWADHATKPADQYVSVVFPCGAVRRGDEWLISSGIHDRWTEIHSFPHAALEKALVPIRPPDGFLFREGTNDKDTFTAVVAHDEYGLRRRPMFAPDDVILDIGAHIGCFALLAAERGAKRLHCYEPEPSNAQAFWSNICLPGRLGGYGSLFAAEAVSDKEGFLYWRPDVNPASMTSGICYAEPPGQAVRVISVNEAIRRAGGNIALMKLDCEGGEYAILRGGDLSGVKAIVGELHDGPLGHHTEAIRTMEEKGFKVVIEPNGPTPRFWAERQ